MLESLRNNIKGPLAKGVLVVIILSFVLTSVGGYLYNSSSQVKAKVNSSEILMHEYQRAYQARIAQIEQQMGQSLADIPSFEALEKNIATSVINQLIDEKLLEQWIKKTNYKPTDEDVKNEIMQIGGFMENGQFSNELYQASLSNARINPVEFAKMVSSSLATQEVTTIINSTDFTPDELSSIVFDLENQTRSFRYINLGQNNFNPQITEKEIEKYYQENQANFQNPQEIKLEYIHFNEDKLIENIENKLTDEKLASFYELNKANYATNEEKKLAHILLDDQKTADLVKEKLSKGDDFKLLAKEYSIDQVTKNIGGDLGVFERGIYQENFENAVFKLNQQGQVSDVIQTDFGFHLILLSDYKDAKILTLEVIKQDLKDDYFAKEKENEFLEIKQKIADITFEEPDSLVNAAKLLNDKIQITSSFSKNNIPNFFKEQELESQIFNQELIKDKLNSDIIELDNYSFIVYRVTDEKPQALQPLDQVKEQIKQIVAADKKRNFALDLSKEMLQVDLNTDDFKILLNKHDLTINELLNIKRQSNENLAFLVADVFSKKKKDIKKGFVAEQANEIYFAVLDEIKQAPKATEDSLLAIENEINANLGRENLANLLIYLKDKSKIKVYD